MRVSQSAIPDASILELYPHEINGLKLVVAGVSRKFVGRWNTLENLVALSNEIEERCREELNLDVLCDFEWDLDSNSNPYLAPKAIPISRLTPEAFDFARARYETQQGFDDGVPGVITEDGRWVEPTKQIAMPGGVDVAGD